MTADLKLDSFFITSYDNFTFLLKSRYFSILVIFSHGNVWGMIKPNTYINGFQNKNTRIIFTLIPISFVNRTFMQFIIYFYTELILPKLYLQVMCLVELFSCRYKSENGDVKKYVWKRKQKERGHGVANDQHVALVGHQQRTVYQPPIIEYWSPPQMCHSKRNEN